MALVFFLVSTSMVDWASEASEDEVLFIRGFQVVLGIFALWLGYTTFFARPPAVNPRENIIPLSDKTCVYCQGALKPEPQLHCPNCRVHVHRSEKQQSNSPEGSVSQENMFLPGERPSLPGKGLYTQCLCVLLSKPATIEEVQNLLKDFPCSEPIPAFPDPYMCGIAIKVSFRPGVHGKVIVDLQDNEWPDKMEESDNRLVQINWKNGSFGPLASSGCLARAGDHKWGWPEADSLTIKHTAYIRIRMTYFHDDEDAPIIPEDCDTIAELRFMTNLAKALLEHPAAVGGFNPSGEMLFNSEMVDRAEEEIAGKNLPPLRLWCNIRLCGSQADWSLVDTVGMNQLDLPDFEACFPAERMDPADVGHFLLGAHARQIWKGPVFKHLDTMDSAEGHRWKAYHVNLSIIPPVRNIIRWLPAESSTVPKELKP